MNDTHISKSEHKYTPTTRWNIGQQNKGWRNQHPWRLKKPGKVYTLSLTMTFCYRKTGQSSELDTWPPEQLTQLISPGKNVQPLGDKCHKCTKSVRVQTLTCEALQWTRSTGFHFVFCVWKCNTLRQYWTSYMTGLV
jgi:hypothetical protein